VGDLYEADEREGKLVLQVGGTSSISLKRGNIFDRKENGR